MRLSPLCPSSPTGPLEGDGNPGLMMGDDAGDVKRDDPLEREDRRLVSVCCPL